MEVANYGMGRAKYFLGVRGALKSSFGRENEKLLFWSASANATRFEDQTRSMMRISRAEKTPEYGWYVGRRRHVLARSRRDKPGKTCATPLQSV